MKTSRIFMLISLIVMLALLVCAGTALAADASDFTYTSSNGEVTITGYTGTDTELVIPAEIDGMPVTGIGQYAFDRCTMQSITLPETLRSIASNAFSYCENLTSVHIPASLTSIAADAFMPYCGVQNFTVSGDNTVYAAVGGVLMSKDLSTLVRYPSARAAWKYSVPAGTKHIGPMAFAQSVNLDLITLPAGLETIGEEAFACCISLCEINLPQSVTQIGEGAFADCSDFLALVVANSYAHIWCQEHGIDAFASSTDVVSGEFACRANGDGTCTITGYLGLDDHVLIPDEIDGLTVTYIAEMAFDRHTFSAITLPDSLEGIGNWAFNYCQNLTAIHLPAGVSRVTAEAFQCYSGIDEITVDEQNACFSAADGVLMSKDQTTLVYRPAANAATEYEVPAGVTVIAGYAFGENRNLERVVLPESVTQINAGAFIWCAGLKEINLPASISYIAENAFADCGNFTATVYHGSYAHNWCLRHGIDVNVLNGVVSEDGRFVINDNGDGTCTITDYLGSEEAIVVPDMINGLTVTGIGKYAFDRCTMQSITLPDTLVSIESNAFSYCQNLTSMHIPAGVNYLRTDAFSPYCGIAKFTVDPDSPFYTSYAHVLFTKDMSVLVKFPAAAPAIEFTVPDGVKHIGGYSFMQNHWIDTVNLPDGVESIGVDAFYDCINLKTINLPASITSISDGAFANCGQLIARVDMDSYAYRWCVENNITVQTSEMAEFTYADNGDGTCTITGLKNLVNEVEIPEYLDGLQVAAIGDRAFCDSLITKVSIPGCVKTIGDSAFANCYLLDEAILSDGIERIGQESFMGCGMNSIVIPSSVVAIGEDAFTSVFDLVIYGKSDTAAEAFADRYGIHFEDTDLISDGTTYISGDYTYRLSNGHAVIIGYSGNAREIEIPAMLDGYSVTEIDGPVFKNKIVTSAVFPEGIVYIGQDVFWGVWDLASITLPSTLVEIGSGAFSGCGMLTEVELPAGLKKIGEEAFSGCGLTSVIIPDSVTSLGRAVFSNCRSLNSVVLSSNIKSPLVYTFSFCSALEEIVIPDGIDSLCCAFIGCDNLRVVTLSNSIEKITSDSFTSAELTSVMLPPYIHTLEANAFDSTTTLYCYTDTLTWQTIAAMVPDANVQPVAPYAYTDNGNGTCTIDRYYGILADVTVPSTINGLTVNVIGTKAFSDNPAVTIILPETITSIGSEAFSKCVSLESIHLPKGISNIENDAFSGSENVIATVFATSYAHTWCVENGINVDVLANEEPISVFTYTDNGDGTCTITGYTGTDMDVVIPSEIDGLTVTGIARGAFERSKMTSLTLPDTLGFIEQEVFSYCENLTALHIPANVYSIATEAFVPYCGVQNITVSEDNLAYADSDGVLMGKDQTMLLHYPVARPDEEYIVQDTVKYIGAMAFAQSLHLNTVVLPDGVESISDRAFSGCVVLEHINLPGSIRDIDDDAFANCGNLVAQVEKGSYAHTWCVEHDIDVDVKDLPFTYTDNGDGTCTITGYTGTDTDVVIPSVIGGLKVTAIGDRAFAYQSDLTSVVIPEGVTTIGMYAFSGCYYLTDAELPETMTTLGNGAFWGCNGLSEIRIPAGVTSIGRGTFGNTSVGITVDSGNTVYKTVDGLLFTADGKELMYVPSNTSGVFAVPEGTEVLSADFQQSNITQISIPASVKKINAIFHMMFSHESFVVDEANTAYRSTNGLLLTKDGTELIRVPSAYPTDGLVVVPDGVRVIRNGAMTYGGGEFYLITEIELPEGITTIESNVTHLCTLNKINLPASLTSIADDAFHNPIGDNVATVYEGTYAEAWCEKNGIIANVLPLPYTYTDNGDGTCTITGYTGTDMDVVIPSEIDGLKVTAIGESAFNMQRNLRYITLPEGVTTIERMAFSNSVFYSIVLPESLTTIGDDAFNCSWVNQTIRIPAATTSIGIRAFAKMEGSITVDSENTAYKMENDALYTADGKTLKCVDINKVGVFSIAEGTETVEGYAFEGVQAITEIRIPASVKTIGEPFHEYGWNLERIVVDEANTAYQVVDGMLLTKDGTELLRMPYHRTGKLVVPDGVQIIWRSAISGYYDAEGQYVGVTEIVLPEGITTLNAMAIEGPIEKINLPASLTTFGRSALYSSSENFVATVHENSAAHTWCVENGINVDALANEEPISVFTYTDNGDGTCTITGYTGTDTDVVIPSEIDGLTVTGIARGAFERSEMTSVTLPDTLGYIEDEAFSYCENLAAIHIPANVYSIGAEAFAPYCGVQNITVSEDNQTYADSDGVLLSKDQTMLLRYPAARSDEEYIVPDTVDYIGSMAFAQSLHLNTVVLPDGMEFISDRAFSGCVVLEHINLPGSILTIDDDDVFANCGNLVAQVEWSSYAHTWCVEHDIDVDVISSLQLIPASRIDANAIPFGMAAEVELVDGLYHVTIDNEATDWDAVYTLQEPMQWYNPDTGESGVAVEKVMVGAMFDKPEGAAYSKSVVGNVWATDEEILNALDQETSVSDLTNTINSWLLDVALFDDDGGITLNEFTEEEYAPYTYAILWLDENGEEMFAEKVEFCFEYTAPEASHTYAKKLIPAESIMGNVENTEGVTCEIADGSIITTQMDANAEYVTEIVAPQNAVSYSMHDNFYDPWAEKYEVTNGVVGFMRSGTLAETITTSSLICWYDADGRVIGGGWITFTSKLGQGAEVPEPAEGVQLLPASRIDANAIPFGMAVEVELKDGLYHVIINNEATDWDAVYTLQEPMHWYNPGTGESGVAVEKVMMGAMFDKPEGAAYSKSIVGNYWKTDEEILQALADATRINDLTSWINSWSLDVAWFNDDGSIRLKEYTEEIYAPYTCAVLWLDENGEEMFAEKVEFCFEYTAPEASHTYAKKLIPAESIMGNVENAEGVTCEIADGSIITTQMDANAEYVTEIVAPQNAVSYSMHDNFYDPWAEKYEVTNGVVGFMRSGPLAETITTSSLICWYDADGQMIGGGWITFTSKLGEKLISFLIPASMQTIEEEAFAGSAAQSVIIPDGCTAIGSRAFADCAQLRQIVIPASVTDIAADAFSGCTNVTVIAPEGSAGQALAEATEGLNWRAE